MTDKIDTIQNFDLKEGQFYECVKAPWGTFQKGHLYGVKQNVQGILGVESESDRIYASTNATFKLVKDVEDKAQKPKVVQFVYAEDSYSVLYNDGTMYESFNGSWTEIKLPK